MIKRIGLPYLILYVFLLLVSVGSSATQFFLEAVAPGWLIIQLITFVSAYFTVIMFNMMGYVVYQYHEDLGFEDVREFAEPESVRRGPRSSASIPAAGTAQPPSDPFETEINVLVNEGKLDEAKDRMHRRVEGPAGTLEDREKYHKLLQLAKDKAESSRHGADYIRALTHTGEGTRAVQVYEDCMRLDPEFQVTDGHQSFRLAERGYAMGRNDTALRLINRFAKRFPKHERTPDAFLLAAKLMCEHKGAGQTGHRHSRRSVASIPLPPAQRRNSGVPGIRAAVDREEPATSGLSLSDLPVEESPGGFRGITGREMLDKQLQIPPMCRMVVSLLIPLGDKNQCLLQTRCVGLKRE